MPAQPDFPDASGALTLAGPAGALEAVVELPEPAHARRGVAIVCHPHPPDGGTMDNKVVTTVARTLRELGLATIRFNFRGIGASVGEYDAGEGETADLLAVADWVRAARPDHALWLAGFSFGAWIAARAAVQLPVAQLIGIAPPVTRFALAEVPRVRAPWLVVQGEADEIVDPQAVFDWIAAMPEPPELVRMPDTGHFFHRKLVELRAVLAAALAARVPPLAAA